MRLLEIAMGRGERGGRRWLKKGKVILQLGESIFIILECVGKPLGNSLVK